MRFLLIAIFLFGAHSINAQCVATADDNCVSVHQSILDRAAKAVNELTEARKAIAAFQNERTATEAERAAYKNLSVVTDMAMGVLQKGIADRDTVIALQQKTLELYSQLVDKLTSQLNKPRSAWQKFVQTVEKVVLLAAGVALGRGL